MEESFFISTERPVGGTERYGWGGIGIFGVGEALIRCHPVGAKDRPGQAPMWYLDALAREAGVRPLTEFLTEDPESAAWKSIAEGDEVPSPGCPPDSEWFAAADGLTTVRGLLQYLTTHTERVAEVRRVLGDLRQFEQLLRRLEREGIRWHLVDGSWW